ncbi:hypothetical protein [Streptomyces sp. SD15]
MASDDLNIPREPQICMAKRAHAHIEEVQAAHAVAVSHPDAVTRIIEKAARTVR